MTIDTGPQVRAAQAWADLKDDAMAAKIGVSVRTLSRLKNGAELTHERREAIREATGVPDWFMTSGFDGANGPEEPSLSERVEALEGQMKTMIDIARSLKLTDRSPAALAEYADDFYAEQLRRRQVPPGGRDATSSRRHTKGS